jgi:hypothetical protein
MRYCIIILLGCFLTGCRENDNNPTMHQLLQGDWEGDTTQDFGRRYLAIEDSVLTDVMHINAKFVLKDSAIQVTPDSIYNIVSVSTDSLVSTMFDQREQRTDTFRFKKIKPYNNQVMPLHIYFASSGCYGSCPAMEMDFDSSGIIHIWGKTKNGTGGFTGQLDTTLYRQLLGRIRSLPIGSMDSLYEAPWTDDQTCYIVIQARDTALSYAAYGHHREPVALRVLFEKLMDLRFAVDFKPDSTVTQEGFYMKYARYAVPYPPPPPPVPPPSPMIRFRPPVIKTD